VPLVFIQQPQIWGHRGDRASAGRNRAAGAGRLRRLHPAEQHHGDQRRRDHRRNPLQEDGSTAYRACDRAAGLPEANLYQLRSGEGVRITYGILRARGEFLNDQDRQPTLSFSGRDGEIDSLESGIGMMLTVELNREEANADADLITLTLFLARINLEDQREAFDSLTIETTHLTGFRPRPAEGPQQLYEVLSSKGTASQVG
jgi:hypothetical protein